MVDRSNLGQADRLYQQYLQYQTVERIFTRNPHMVAFTLEAEPIDSDNPEERQEAEQVTVSAEDIATPPQMLAAIKQQVEERIKHINQQLSELGVSASTATPAPQAAPQPKREPEKHEPKQAPRTTPRPTSHKR